MSDAHLRRPAALWLAVTTLFGLAGTVVGLFPVIVTMSAFRAGHGSFLAVILTMVPYCALMLCPLAAWWMLLKRKYTLALIIATPPILMWAISLILSRVFGVQ